MHFVPGGERSRLPSNSSPPRGQSDTGKAVPIKQKRFHHLPRRQCLAETQCGISVRIHPSIHRICAPGKSLERGRNGEERDRLRPRRGHCRQRRLYADNNFRRHPNQRPDRERRILRLPDITEIHPRRSAGSRYLDTGRQHQRRTPLCIPRHASRRMPALLPSRIRKRVYRPAGAAQHEYLPLAPDGRPRLANRNKEISEADGNRLHAQPHRHRQSKKRGIRQHPVRRLLYAGTGQRDCEVRARALHHRDSRSRPARTHACRLSRLPRYGMYGRTVRSISRLGHL